MLPPRAFSSLWLLPLSQLGWFFLWFLLVLGFCFNLFPEPMPQPKSAIQWPLLEGSFCEGDIIQLYVTPLKQYRKQAASSRLQDKTRAELAAIVPWHTAELTGASLNDFITIQACITCLQAIQKDTCHVVGVRIRFRSKATYRSLIEMLMVVGLQNQRNYWLDMQSEPVTLYVVTTPAITARNAR